MEKSYFCNYLAQCLNKKGRLIKRGVYLYYFLGFLSTQNLTCHPKTTHKLCHRGIYNNRFFTSPLSSTNLKAYLTGGSSLRTNISQWKQDK